MSITFFLATMLASQLVPNSGFEQGFEGWSAFWSRDRDGGQAVLDRQVRHSGKQAVRIEHHGGNDWSFAPALSVPVRAGDVLILEAWVRVHGQGSATLGAILYDAHDKALHWTWGARTLRETQDWSHMRSRLVIPDGATRIVPRLIGYGPATVWLDDLQLTRHGNLDALKSKNLPKTVQMHNASLSVTLTTSDGTLTVQDLRNGRKWSQRAPWRNGLVTQATAGARRIDWDWYVPVTDATVHVTAQLDQSSPECVVTLSAEGDLSDPLRYPHPFVTEANSYLVVPMNEGISYPVDDPSIQPRRLIAYGGHGICMAFWGATDGKAGQMAIIETPDDAAIRIARKDGRLFVAPEWDAQLGDFGYTRRLRYVFFQDGGHVAMCKRYRRYVQDQGRLKSLAEKRRENPNVDLLVGAVNVWCWDRDALRIVRELKDAGIQRILWSRRQEPDVIRAMNDMGILTSRYDIYQDVMDPANFKNLHGVHPDWTTRAWPEDLMIGQNGEWTRGWRVRGKDGQWFPCGVLCDRQAVDYAHRRVPPELETHPFRCRFIDTTTAAPWRECYNPNHPMTRSDSRHWKMELLRYMSEEMKLVTGSETGHDASVPYVHYFEGMLSLGPYRVPDAGRNMGQILDEVPERVAKFQVGERYRLPLWELVYHDCVVAQWYWGDYNNKLPAIWDKRDLFNTLYGTPPMFMFNRRFWEANRDRFAQSYRMIGPVARATGYSEMTDHRFLTENRNVQQTVFANGVVVTVNFGPEPYRMADGRVLPPMQCDVAGLPKGVGGFKTQLSPGKALAANGYTGLASIASCSL